MIPNWAIVMFDATSCVALAGVLAALLARGLRRARPVGLILLGVAAVMLVVAQSNVLEWTGLVPRADLLEDFVCPLVPILYLFLFVVGLERADRERLQRLIEQVTESEARHRLLVENAHVAIAVVDANRNITFWNRGMEQLFGWSAQEAAGRSVNLIYPPDKLDGVMHEILPSLEREGLWFGEHPLVRKDGSRFTGFMSLARVFDPICTLGVITDMTEHIQLREQLIEVQKMETVGALASGIAHDFNNLLTAVSGFATLLKTSLPAGSEDHESAVSIEQATQRGTQLVRQLMAFSHRQPAHAEPVNLNDLVREVGDLIKHTFPRTVEPVMNLAPDLVLIRGDPTQMHQVLMNLAINARDAMPQGGRLTIATENLDLAPDDPRGAGLKPGPCVRLSVADTGMGISPEAQPHIFEPFFTTKPVSLGTGLGLWTVYAIVRRHNGRVTFRTAPGRGTTFYIVLPATV
jgi:PAS domain S-box-containing protein